MRPCNILLLSQTPNTNNRAFTMVPVQLWIYVCRVHKTAEKTLEEQWALNSAPELKLYRLKVVKFLNCEQPESLWQPLTGQYWFWLSPPRLIRAWERCINKERPRPEMSRQIKKKRHHQKLSVPGSNPESKLFLSVSLEKVMAISLVSLVTFPRKIKRQSCFSGNIPTLGRLVWGLSINSHAVLWWCLQNSPRRNVGVQEIFNKLTY